MIHSAGVDLSIGRGEIFGLLGPNGAGKTTFIKILSGLILPTAGTATIEGSDAGRGTAARWKLGLVTSDDRSFYWRLSGRDNLRFFARLYDLPKAVMNERIAALLDRVELTDAAGKTFSTYSSGMRQRLGIARALLHDPPVLLLDEPTRSLDPLSSRALRKFVKEELSEKSGKTILLATHNLHEAAALCDRIAILAKGRILAIGTPDSIRKFGIPSESYRVELAGGAVVDLSLADGEILGDRLAALQREGARIVGCDRVEADLEEAFERIVGDGDGGGDGGGHDGDTAQSAA